MYGVDTELRLGGMSIIQHIDSPRYGPLDTELLLLQALPWELLWCPISISFLTFEDVQDDL